MNRRKFISLISLAVVSKLFANTKVKNNVNIFMHGDIDDDLIITKNKFSSFDFEVLECFQMHNMRGKFNIGAVTCKSVQIPGYIEFEKNYTLKDDEVISIFTANEREDRSSMKHLMMRSHYKSAELKVNNTELIPSLIPEKDDVKGYPTWFGRGENSSYNYYQLWENAVINTGLVFARSGKYKIICLDAEGEFVAQETVEVSKATQAVKFKSLRDAKSISTHPFAEVDGTVFDEHTEMSDDMMSDDMIVSKTMNDKLIRKNAITTIAIENKVGAMTLITLPYPMPYINRIFVTSSGVA